MNQLKIRIPKYVHVYEQLKADIVNGRIKPNEQVPTVLELMKIHVVSKITAVRVLSELQNAGLIRKEQGRGSFVNDFTKIEQERQERVESAVEILIPDIANPFYSEIVSAISQKFQGRNIPIRLHNMQLIPDQWLNQLTQVVAREPAGIILAPGVLDFPDTARNLLAGRRVVFIDYNPELVKGAFSYVVNDNLRGGQIATRHLLELGHQRIGMVISKDTNPDRIRGYRIEMEKHKAEPQILDYTMHKGGLAGSLVSFVKEQSLTALATANDVLAVNVKKVLEQSNLLVPRDISLIGYDNIEISEYLDVPLTTVDQHEAKIGSRAAEIILTLSDLPSSVDRIFEVVYEPTLVVRASTAPLHR